MKRIISILLLVFTSACLHEDKTSTVVVDLSEIAAGIVSPYSDSQAFIVFASHTEFQGAFEMSFPAQSAPVFSFDSETIIGLFRGIQNSAWPTIEATGFKADKGILTVFLDLVDLDVSCNLENIVTSPFQFIKIGGKYNSVFFEANQTIRKCNDDPTHSLGPVSFEELTINNQLNRNGRHLQIIDNQTDLDYIFAKNSANSTLEALSTIDFNQYSIAMVQAGLQSSLGYEIYYTDLTLFDTHLQLQSHFVQPSSTCNVAGSESSPFQFIIFPKTNLWMLFDESTSLRTCGFVGVPAIGFVTQSSIVDQGDYSDYLSGRVLTEFTNQTEFELAYSESGNSTDRASAPILDFESNHVVGIFLHKLNYTGQQPINITSIEGGVLSLDISVEITKLAAGCLADGAISRPYQIVQFPRVEFSSSSVPILFKETLKIVDCMD